MNIILDLVCISIILVYITDITDFPDNIKKGIKWVLTKGKMSGSDYRLHLIDCSRCQLWWAGIIYLLCTGNFTLPYLVVVAILSCFASVIKDAIILLKDVLVKINQVIYKIFKL